MEFNKNKKGSTVNIVIKIKSTSSCIETEEMLLKCSM